MIALAIIIFAAYVLVGIGTYMESSEEAPRFTGLSIVGAIIWPILALLIIGQKLVKWA